MYPPSGNSWRLSYSTYQEYLKDNRIWFGVNGDNVPSIKRFLSEVKDGTTSSTIWEYDEVGHTDKAKKELNQLFEGKSYFDYPKSVELIKKMLILGTNNDSTILDFFSGSATTAHAIMKLNAEDGGSRKFILVQLPELCGEKSEAYKAGYKNICEIGKERIRRAGAKIIAEKKTHQDDFFGAITDDIQEKGLFEATAGLKANTGSNGLDIGFRVLKLDSSNMQNVYYNPNAMSQDLLELTIDNIKPDRTPMDLLFQVMLSLGVELSAKIEEKEVAGKNYYIVNNGALIACFDDNINNEAITEIAKLHPIYAVFRDKSFANDSVGINNEQLFKTYSPSTIVKVL